MYLWKLNMSLHCMWFLLFVDIETVTFNHFICYANILLSLLIVKAKSPVVLVKRSHESVPTEYILFCKCNRSKGQLFVAFSILPSLSFQFWPLNVSQAVQIRHCPFLLMILLAFFHEFIFNTKINNQFWRFSLKQNKNKK